jgi:hypothetical protein
LYTGEAELAKGKPACPAEGATFWSASERKATAFVWGAESVGWRSREDHYELEDDSNFSLMYFPCLVLYPHLSVFRLSKMKADRIREVLRSKRGSRQKQSDEKYR